MTTQLAPALRSALVEARAGIATIHGDDCTHGTADGSVELSGPGMQTKVNDFIFLLTYERARRTQPRPPAWASATSGPDLDRRRRLEAGTRVARFVPPHVRQTIINGTLPPAPTTGPSVFI